MEGACFTFENPACDVTAPKPSTPTEGGEAEASVVNGPGPSGSLEINTKHVPMFIYYVNEHFKGKMISFLEIHCALILSVTKP